MNRGLPRKSRVALLLAACAFCLLWRCVLIFHFKEGNVRTELATDTRFDSLLFGAALAIGANPALDRSRWFAIERLRWLALGGLAVLLITFAWRNDGFRFTLRFTLQSAALLPVFRLRHPRARNRYPQTSQHMGDGPARRHVLRSLPDTLAFSGVLQSSPASR